MKDLSQVVESEANESAEESTNKLLERIKELEDEISDLKCTIYQVETTVKTLMRLR